MNAAQIRADYRRADRRARDRLWMAYIGMRDDFDQIERDAKDKCRECEHNPHTVGCVHAPKRGAS